VLSSSLAGSNKFLASPKLRRLSERPMSARERVNEQSSLACSCLCACLRVCVCLFISSGAEGAHYKYKFAALGTPRAKERREELRILLLQWARAGGQHNASCVFLWGHLASRLAS